MTREEDSDEPADEQGLERLGLQHRAGEIAEDLDDTTVKVPAAWLDELAGYKVVENTDQMPEKRYDAEAVRLRMNEEIERSRLPGIDHRLSWMLRVLGDEFGPMGVALVAAQLTDKDVLIHRLTVPQETSPKADTPRYSWTQPVCPGCYGEKNPGRTPVVLIETKREACCFCGAVTRDGIYFRVDPATCPNPTLLKD